MLSQICARDNLHGVSYYGLMRRQRNRGSQLASLAAPGFVTLPHCEGDDVARANARIHLVLRHIDADDNEIILCHHPLPSLLGSGSKPLQLFGLRKKPELSLALRQAQSPKRHYAQRERAVHIVVDFSRRRSKVLASES
jgi:hypothetical protein